jgi:hypothetical protein
LISRNPLTSVFIYLVFFFVVSQVLDIWMDRNILQPAVIQHLRTVVSRDPGSGTDATSAPKAVPAPKAARLPPSEDPLAAQATVARSRAELSFH